MCTIHVSLPPPSTIGIIGQAQPALPPNSIPFSQGACVQCHSQSIRNGWLLIGSYIIAPLISS